MKTFLISFIIIILVTFVSVLLFNIFESKPFKFENFKNAEGAKAYMDKHYPLGEDISKILKDVSLAGATCIERPEKIAKHRISIHIEGEYKKIYECSYSNNFISLDPFSGYYLMIYSDHNEKLVGIFVKKESKIEFP